ncbi:hypothetical protein AGABI2DRAFT_213201 [Agaricus bisporus var. bisporus H97]|uniref:hypothetical protein n=1 Tax=Agaricus bisporus var. bisporus (strain H97 / ATCC MYA-4626 / FGSC 10389) TaxID=936046 RepID=UPI00029F7025|nr:hypothetical protein AGABI2DRAFT_213201 [Agaricus bisporus var. bisporus H97]EKV41619.1 hypothetical protein AGABI2DRAFT_213201 [Agaricus bisporus var. bisporus H97]
MVSSCYLFTLLFAWIGGVKGADSTTYGLVRDYSGENFFDGWTFYGDFDNVTNGDADFVAKENSSDLAFFDSTTGHTIMKVDNTSAVLFNEKRRTVRITSDFAYSIGSVFVFDVYHMPFGCSVWPAMWTTALLQPGQKWPTGGEIDIMEGINLNPNPQMGLHTTSGCTQMDPKQSSSFINGTDCEGAGGCITTYDDEASYGTAFAAKGGGAFVTEFSNNGISMWFFERPNVPDSLKNNESSIDTSTLGIPMGHYPSTGCDIGEFFGKQNLIFDITLCGDFAGAPTYFSLTCTGQCYQDYVMGDGSVYGDAYFEVDYVRVFSLNGTEPPSAPSSSPVALPTMHKVQGNGVTRARISWLFAVIVGVVLWA